MYRNLKRFLSAFLILLMIMLVALPSAQAAGPAVDGAAFGPSFSELEVRYDWVDISEPQADMQQLLNTQPLHPQRTGWVELDQLIANLLDQAGSNADPYTKLRYAYDWLVENVTYSWDGYSYYNASVRCYNSFTELNYLPGLTYETGLDRVIPDDMANRAYHVLHAKKGVCYDYAIAFSVIARYVGIEAYVQTGPFVFETDANGTGHHGWSILMLDNTRYIFDPQRDARNWQYNSQNGYYFGILESTVLDTDVRPSYAHTDDDIAAFDLRLQQTLPVTSERCALVTVSANATGGGHYALGSTATLQAAATHDHFLFDGWYTPDGSCVSTDRTYHFTVTAPVTLTAKTSIGPNCPSAAMHDLNPYNWYHDYTDYVLENSFMNGIGSGKFAPNNTITRAEICQILYNMEQRPAVQTDSAFRDVKPTQWYHDAITWAAEHNIVHGNGHGRFDPTAPITRQELAVILHGYANFKAVQTDEQADLTDYADDTQISSWALPAMQWANATGMITGNGRNCLNPTGSALRCEAAKIFTVFCQNMNAPT